MLYRTEEPTKKEPFKPPEARLAFLIYRSGVSITRRMEAALKPLGLSPGEVGLMTYLATKNCDHVRAAGRALGVSPQTIVNLARTLENRSLLRRAPSPDDARTIKLTLTADGQRALVVADGYARALDAKVAAMAGNAAGPMAEVLRRLIDDSSTAEE